MNATTMTISQLMTSAPHAIEPNETLAVARKRMQDLNVRHLPVRIGGKVVGVITERDLYLLGVFPEIDFKHAKVRFAMSPDPYKVGPEAQVAVVVREMAQRRIGSVLVVDNEDRLLGIFTDTDALDALATLLLTSPPISIKPEGIAGAPKDTSPRFGAYGNL